MARRPSPTLAAYLDAPGHSQTQLAKALGVQQSTISQWVRGVRIPRPDLALTLHALTGVPLKALLAKVGKRGPPGNERSRSPTRRATTPTKKTTTPRRPDADDAHRRSRAPTYLAD